MMFHAVTMKNKHDIYVSAVGFDDAVSALLHGEKTLSDDDLGVVGVFEITTLHERHPIHPALHPIGIWLKPTW